MADEHDDDIEPQVDVGAEIETVRFPKVSEDFDDEDKKGSVADESAPAEGLDDDQGDEI